MAAKYCIGVGAGVIDADLRGEIKVILYNHGKENFDIKKGDRIAHLILERNETPEVDEVDETDATARGERGFGSTGGVSSTAEKACVAWFSRDSHSIHSVENGIGHQLIQENAEVLYIIKPVLHHLPEEVHHTTAGAEYVVVPISHETCPSLLKELKKREAERITELAREVIALELKRAINMLKSAGILKKVPPGRLEEDAIAAAID